MVKIYFSLALLVLAIWCLEDSVAMPAHDLVRRDNFDEFMSELRSKGSRMRFGKRSNLPIHSLELQPPQQQFVYYLAIPA